MEKDKAAEAAKKTKATYDYLSLFAHLRAAGLPYLLTFDSEQTFFDGGPPREWDANQFETGLYFLLTVVQAFFSTVDALVLDTTGEAEDDRRNRASELSGMNLGRRLAQLEDETAPSAEIGSWCTRDGEPFSPSPELRTYVEQEAERPARVAFWVRDAEPGPVVLLLPEVGARTPPQAIEVPPELAER